MWNPLSNGSVPSRWRATRTAARLGIIAATLSGLALAFHVGGTDGYSVPLAGLLGAPTNVFVFRALSLFIKLPHDLIGSGGPASTWNIWHVIFTGSIALNWTALGLLVDFTRPPDEEPHEEAAVAGGTVTGLPPADPLRDGLDELGRKVRGREPGPRSRLPLEIARPAG